MFVAGLLRRKELFVIVFFVLLFLSIFLPSVQVLKDYTILSIITLLFSILSGSATASAWSEFERARRSVGQEASEITNIYTNISVFNKKIQNKFRELLYKYLVYSVIVPWEKIEKMNNVFYDISKFLIRLKMRNKTQEMALKEIVSTLGKWEDSREEQVSLGTSRIAPVRWLMLIILGGTLIFVLYVIKTSDVFSIILTTLISLAVILVLIIIKDLDDYSFGESDFVLNSFFPLFDMIKKPRFYWEEHIKSKAISVPKGVKNYTTKIPKKYEKDLLDVLKE